jgi:SAM-dependent methyltransferase
MIMRRIWYGRIFMENNIVRQVKNCRGCKGGRLAKWVDLGNQPLANAFLQSDKNTAETCFPLTLVYCIDCELVQIGHVVDPKVLFKDYLYYSSTSSVFRDHFDRLAMVLFYNGEIKKDDLVVDIGSNDGVLLSPFKSRGAKVLGVEPVKEIAERATKSGIPTMNKYFSREVAGKILDDMGTAKLITMTNVFAHVDDLDEVLEGVKLLLADDGRFMIEVPYLPKMIESGTFDLIYHEHLSYFHLYPLQVLLERKGFSISSFQEVDVHGGSLRVFAKTKPGSSLGIKTDEGLIKKPAFHKFPRRIKEYKIGMKTYLEMLKVQGKSIVGYGAPAKMTVLTNYVDIDASIVSWIIDDSPEKQNKYLSREAY